MRVVFIILAVSAALLTALIVGLIGMLAYGTTNIVFPSFGLVVTLNFIVHVLIAADGFVAGLAVLIKRRIRKR